MAILTRKTQVSTSRTQTEIFTIPGLTKLNSVTVNTGNAEIIDVDGDKVTVRFSGGSYTRRVQTGGSYTPADTKYVTGQISANYNSGGYSGSLTRYLQSGSLTPADSKRISDYRRTLFLSPNVLDEIFNNNGGKYRTHSYNEGGYSGTLQMDDMIPRWSGVPEGEVSSEQPTGVTFIYLGTVTRPESDTRVYRYRGDVTKPASDTRTYSYYYQYDITIDYTDNSEPSLTLITTKDQTLYENDTLTIEGRAKDEDENDIVNIYYRINDGSRRAVDSKVSDGKSEISFKKSLTFKSAKLYDGNTAITSDLKDGESYKLEVWAEDDNDGKSEIIERTFYVVPNRPPSLTVDSFDGLSDLINADKITLTGSTFDPDRNDMVVSYKLNGGLNTEIYSGKDGDWSFDLLLKDLNDGENTIVVETIDSYDFKASETITVNKTTNLTPLTQSVQRYTIVPPAGSAQGVLLWIERDKNQEINVEISMTNGNEQEVFKSMELDSSGPLNTDTIEDFFKIRSDEPAENIAIKITWTGDKPIYSVSGALTQ